MSVSDTPEVADKQPKTPTAKSVVSRNPWLAMVIVAFLLRLAVMPFLIGEQLVPERNHWRFGYEAGRIAYSIAEGHGFSSPLFTPTGPTAWLGPIYVYVVAAVFNLFGSYTVTSACVVLGLNGLISALTCIPIFLIALISFGERTARWAGWLWAFFPYAIYFPIERIWETWLATLLLALVFWLTQRLACGLRTWAWLGFGALWGVAILNSPVVLTVLPGLLCWICYSLYRSQKPYLLRSALSMCVLAAVVAPWLIRNTLVLHKFVPLRDSLGLELYIGNCGDGVHWRAASSLGPWHNDDEWREFREIGELAYMKHKQQQALECIGQHRGRYAWMTLRRVAYSWTGYWSFGRAYLSQEPLDLANIPFCTLFTAMAFVGLGRAFRANRLGAAPYAITLLFFPVIYYFTHPEVYFMRPLDPLVVILAAYAFTSRRGVAAVVPQAVTG